MEQPIVQKINCVVDALDSVNQSLQHVDAALEKVEAVVADVETTIRLVRECTSALKVLKTTSSALSFVPVVNVFMKVLSKTIGTVEDVLNPLSKTLSVVDKSLSSLKKEMRVVKTGISTTVNFNTEVQTYLPKITTTLTALHYVLQIVEVVLPLVKGTELQEKLGEVRAKLDGIEKSVEQPVADFEQALTVISSSLAYVQDWCTRLKEKTKNIAGVINAFQSVGEIISPISNAIKKVLDAIAPIRWVLQAAACLIDKVLTPVINLVLRVTGLQKLIDEMGQRILEKLGISALIDEIKETIVNDTLLVELERIADFKSMLSAKFDMLCACLEDFSPTKNIVLKEKIETLFLSFWDAAIDLSKPVLIPDWPDEPEFLSSRAVPGCLQRMPRLSWEKPRAFPVVLPRRTQAVGGVAYKTAIAAGIAVQVSCLYASLGRLQDKRADFEEGFALLSKAVSLPDCFQAELSAVEEYLHFIRESVSFIMETFTLSSGCTVVLQDVQESIDRLASDCRTLATSLSGLTGAVEAYHSAMKKILENIPSGSAISGLEISVGEFASQADVLLASFSLADEHHPDAALCDSLQEIKGRVEENADALLLQLKDATTCVDGITDCISALSDVQTTVSECFQALSPDGYLLPEKTIQRLTAIAGILKQIEGLLDPLYLLVDTLRTKKTDAQDGSLDLVSKSRTLLRQFADHLNTSVESTVQCVGQIEVVLPIEQLNGRLKRLQESLSIDEEQEKTLLHEVYRMKSFMEEGMSYVIDGQTITNKYLSSTDIDKLKTLSFAIVSH